MNKELLEDCIKRGLTQKETAIELEAGYSTVKKYMKIYKLKTLHVVIAVENCLWCNQVLIGSQKKFCSNNCSCNHHNRINGNGSTYIKQKERGADRKKKLIEMKGGGCQICGYNKCTAALSFHHRDPTQKKITLDVRTLSNRPFEKSLEEAEKCDLLCLNCHMEEHYMSDELL